MLLRFKYVNWRDEDHEYVIEIPSPSDQVAQPRVQWGLHPRAGEQVTHDAYWMVSGQVVTRDGDPRPDMGPTRRRSFELVRMRDIEEIPSSAW